MRRFLATVVIALAAALAGPAAIAGAQATGGTGATDGSMAAPTPAGTPAAAPPPASGTGGGTSSNGGGSAPTGVTPASSGANGGNTYGRRFNIPPVVKSFGASPRSVVWGGAPTRLRFRIEAIGSSRRCASGSPPAARAATSARQPGPAATNRTMNVRWHRAGMSPGAYTAYPTVVDTRGRALARAARAGLAVGRSEAQAAPAPSPVRARARGVPRRRPALVGTRASASTAATTSTGPGHARRRGHAAGRGALEVVFATGYAASGAGEYVVLYDSSANRSYVYMHLDRGSTTVGRPVGPRRASGSERWGHRRLHRAAPAFRALGRPLVRRRARDRPAPTLRSWD